MVKEKIRFSRSISTLQDTIFCNAKRRYRSSECLLKKDTVCHTDLFPQTTGRTAMPAEYLCHCLLCIEQILIYIADRSIDVDLIPAVCLSECCHSLSGTDRLDNLAVLRRSLADICARRCLNREGLCKCTYAILCIYRRAVRRSRRGCCRAVCVRCGLPTELLLDRLLTLLICLRSYDLLRYELL